MALFSGKELTDSVAAILPKDPKPNQKIVVGTFDKDGVGVVASFKHNGEKLEWELQAAAHHDWSGDNKVGAKVLLEW